MLLTLPTELLLLIADALTHERDIYALILTARRLAHLLLPRLQLLALKPKDNLNALFWAVSGNRPLFVKWLTSQPIDLDLQEPNCSNQTALHEAAARGYVPIVKTLVESGADVSCRDKWGYTPLHGAASRPWNGAVVRLLLEGGAGVADRGGDGETVFNNVIYRRWSWNIDNVRVYEETIRLLLRQTIVQGVKIELPVYLVLAVAKDGYRDLVELVLEGWSGVLDVHGASYAEIMLRGAALGGRMEIAMLLLEKGVDIHAVDENGKTALHMAFRCLGTEQTIYNMVLLLIQHGADPMVEDKGKHTARTMARYRYGDPSPILSLLGKNQAPRSCELEVRQRKGLGISPGKRQQAVDKPRWYLSLTGSWRKIVGQ